MDMQRTERIVEANGGYIFKIEGVSGVSTGIYDRIVYQRDYDNFSSFLHLGLTHEESLRYEDQTLIMSIRGEAGIIMMMRVSIGCGHLEVRHTCERGTDQQELYRGILSDVPQHHRVTHIALNREDRVNLSPVAPLHRVTLQQLVKQEARYFPWLRERYHALEQRLSRIQYPARPSDEAYTQLFEHATRFMVSFLV